MSELFERLKKAIIDGDDEGALALTQSALQEGISADDILQQGLIPGIRRVGELFNAGEYFLPQLMMAGEILKQISEIVKPLITDTTEKKKHGKVLMGTVKGDIHDIGKDIVTFMLDVNGFDVMDIGIDVPPEKFVEAIKEFQPSVVGMSGLLTLAYDSMKETVDAIAEAGLRDNVKIMIGGGQMSQKVCEYACADAYGKDALEGVRLAKEWIGVE